MKKLLLVVLAAALVGCAHQPPYYATTSDKGQTIEGKTAKEVCYDGVVYVFFGEHHAKWGSAKIDANNKVVTCTAQR